MSKVITTLILGGLLLTSFSFAQQPITSPKTLEEAKEKGEKALQTIPKELPGILKKFWKEEVFPIWQKIWDWFKKNIWDRYIEKRKPIIEKEFQKEKKELKEELPKVSKSLWEKFKELMK